MKKVFFFFVVTYSFAHCNPPATSNTPPPFPDSVRTVSNDSAQKSPPGPDLSMKITPEYAASVARGAYFWAWPMVNIYNRRLAFEQVHEQGLTGGLVPAAPLNSLSMLSNYVEPMERIVACPNQDVVYGGGIAAFDKSPIVIQVPDFGNRFWVYQVVDLRTDGFAQLGAMYGTKPGFYLLTGQDWNGKVPDGITKVFRCPTSTAFIVPRVFLSDAPGDLAEVQKLTQGISMYPLAEYDGKMKIKDWKTLPNLPAPPGSSEEVHWVFPEKIFDELPALLKDAPPLRGEDARYAQVLAVIDAANKDPKIKEAMVKAAKEAEEQIVKPVFEFRNWGVQLPYHWSTILNGAAFGTDYFTRTAVAKSNILVNAAKETRYFYQDQDSAGSRLNGANKYTVTFAKGQTPPVNGFWSLTLYNRFHFFEPNEIKRYSLGTKNQSMKYNADGSLTLYVQSTPPAEEWKNNWLPSPKKGEFSLYIRAYGPKDETINGTWTPPAVAKAK